MTQVRHVRILTQLYGRKPAVIPPSRAGAGRTPPSGSGRKPGLAVPSRGGMEAHVVRLEGWSILGKSRILVAASTLSGTQAFGARGICSFSRPDIGVPHSTRQVRRVQMALPLTLPPCVIGPRILTLAGGFSSRRGVMAWRIQSSI